MRFRRVPFPAVLGVLLAAHAGATSHYSYVGKPDAEIYFGHIAYCDSRGDEGDPKVVRDGRKTGERAVANTPLLPGDTLVTGSGRRCEVQFDTGTVVRLDGATRLRIETILAPALSRNAGVTNFLLAAGRIEVRYRHYEKSEVFQVLTPTAAVKLRDRAAITIALETDGSTAVATGSGSAQVLFDREVGETRRRTVAAGQRIVFGLGHSGGESAPPESAALLEFRSWNEARDREASPQEAASGSRTVPALRDSPPVVLDFAARSENWGAWVSSDVYGSVWRPHDNDRPGWRPYLEGQWAPVERDLFWVADEPWGWVPYHLGYWTSLRGHGWVWVPGSLFAPAWVRWSPNQTLVNWRPVDIWDFYGDDFPLTWPGWDDGGAGGEITSPPPGVRPPDHAVPRRRPAPPSAEAPAPAHERPRPREVQVIQARMSKAAGASLTRLQDEAALVRRSSVTVPRENLRPEGQAKARPDPAAEGTAVASTPKASEPQAATASPSVLYTPLPIETALGFFPRARFRDWNPDAPLARALGGRLSYSSQNNTVICVSCASPLVRPATGPYGAGGNSFPPGGGSSTSTSGSPATAAPAASPAAQSGGGREGTFAGGSVRRDN